MTLRQTKITYEIGRRLCYLGRRKGPQTGAEDTLTPCDKSARCDKFNILQVNISGIQNKTDELLKLLKENDVRIALIQETILPSHSEISTPGYSQHRCDCHKCQGIMTLIRLDTQAEVVKHPAGDLDLQNITVWLGKVKFTIYNVYWPNHSFKEFPLKETTYKRTILAGDFNAHTPSLGYPVYNQRGREVEDLCNSSNLILQQDMHSKPTLLHRRHLTASRPDLTILSADLLENTTVRVLDDIGSDHLPILTSIQKEFKLKPKIRRTFWNFKKASWNDFSAATDAGMGLVDIDNDSLDKVSSDICKVILDAAKTNIPNGSVKKFRPYWTKDLEKTVLERRRAREKAKKEPTAANRNNYNRLTAKVRYLTRTGKRFKWKETCRKLDLNRNGHKAWKLLGNLEGSSKKENPKPITKDGIKIADERKKANIFNNYLAGVNKSTRRRNLDKALWKLYKRKVKSPSCSARPFDIDFTQQELDNAIKKAAHKKAPGPDGITNEMISHLGTLAKEGLLKFINRSWKEGKLPSSWRTARITPILKKGKPAGQPQSYRPISLTSCLGKVAERMINTRLYYWLEKNGILSNAQAGFRKGCRTEDQLFRFVQSTIDGFQDGKSTTAVFIDLQQAYDRVWRKGLLMKMNNMGIHGKLLQWIHAFLTERTIQTTVDGTTSSKKPLEEGLPQGSALSCTLFLIFINDLPPQIKISKALFADDLVIWTTEKYPILARAKLKRALGTITAYCNFWKIKINKQKSIYSIFSRSPKVAGTELNLELDGARLQKEINPAYLGVTLDRELRMNPFIAALKDKASRRLNLVKRLATTTWGADKSTLRQLYLGYVRSAMDYALPIQAIASKNTSAPLDRIQNQGLRLVCGGKRSTPIAACEIEANIGPPDLHRERAVLESVERYKRFEEGHPNRDLVDSWTPVQRLQQQSPMDVALRLTQQHHLPQERLPIHRYPSTAPWSKLKSPTIRTSLLDPSVNKSTDPVTLRSETMKTIDSYPDNWIHGYTDGSAFKGTAFAGFGVYLRFPDGTSSDFSDACGKTCSNFEAEIAALISATELSHQHFELQSHPPSNIVLFSDSKSALEALENYDTNSHRDIGKLAESIDGLLTSYDIQITLQWVPGHSDVRGNEHADQLAKQGAGKEQPDKPCSYDTARQILRNNFKEVWYNRWATGTTGRVMFQEMDKPKPKDPIHQLPRPDQSLIFQFRVQHTQLNSDINRFNPLHLPLCRNCSHPYETVEHVLFKCPKLHQSRRQLLPQLPTISNVLYGSYAQLVNTCTFIRSFF